LEVVYILKIKILLVMSILCVLMRELVEEEEFEFEEDVNANDGKD
jgi:hypothetical protein